MKIYTGTSGWSYKEWKGIFYPPKISPKDMLRFYAERLNAVEINNTFYHMPTERILLSWAEQVPEDFVFAFKAPQVITHFKRLKNVEEETSYLFRTLTVLEERLGPVLFQFPASFRADGAALKAFLKLIPPAIACAFEFRSATRQNTEITGLLKGKGCSICTVDTDEAPAQEIANTASWGYLRLRRSNYSDGSLSDWMKNIHSTGWDRAYVFFKHEDEAEGPKAAVRFREFSM